MKLHEFQSKEILRGYRVPTPAGEVAADPAAAGRIIEDNQKYPLVVKAQILAGGRGQGGGVRVCRDRAEALAAAEAILGMNLVTAQTGGQGQKVGRILLEQGVAIEQEFYLSLVVDRASAGIAILASAAGGMNIEELAAEQPELVVKVLVDPLAGLAGYHLRQLAFGLDLAPELHQEFAALCRNLYRCFTACDCLLLEINPLVLTVASKTEPVGDVANAYQTPKQFPIPVLSPWTPSWKLMTTPSFGTRSWRPCGIRPRSRSRSAGRGPPASTTSALRAISPAWSTGPGWPWPPWT